MVKSHETERRGRRKEVVVQPVVLPLPDLPVPAVQGPARLSVTVVRSCLREQVRIQAAQPQSAHVEREVIPRKTQDGVRRGIPAVVGVSNARSSLQTGMSVVVDGSKGEIEILGTTQ